MIARFELLRLAGGAIGSQRGRSVLTGLGIAVGIAAVVLLTAIGHGVQVFVMQEFTQFGTRLIAVTPGKTNTMGMSGAVINNIRPLSLDDALALNDLPGIQAVLPVVQGNAAVELGARSRRCLVFGVGTAVPEVWQIRPVLGRFLPAGDARQAGAYAVLGSRLRTELFGTRSPLGERVRIGGETFRVLGVMESKGQMLGFDLDDSVYIPIAKALDMFNRESLMEIDLLYAPGNDPTHVSGRIRERLMQRHGREDFSIISQDQMQQVLGSVLDILTIAVAALGGVSLVVGGVGILTIMTISIQERTSEIGLLRALGATRRQVLVLFLAEALALAGSGGLAGVAIGLGGAWALQAALPQLPVSVSPVYVLLALSTALVIGVAAGILPALRAAAMDPVDALRAE